MLETKVNDLNRSDFYTNVYPMQMDAADALADIKNETRDIVAIDCCGWHYAKVFSKPIIMLETITSIKNYKLSQTQFTKMIDDRRDPIQWPTLQDIKNPVIILDRSPLLKYRGLPEIMRMIGQIISSYEPGRMIIRGRLQFVDDSRMQDRLQAWVNFMRVPGFVFSKFLYDTDSMRYEVDLRKYS